MDEELKAYLDGIEARMAERVYDLETKLLTAFNGYQESAGLRIKRMEASDFTIAERLTSLEERVLRLETDRPPAAGQSH